MLHSKSRFICKTLGSLFFNEKKKTNHTMFFICSNGTCMIRLTEDGCWDGVGYRGLEGWG